MPIDKGSKVSGVMGGIEAINGTHHLTKTIIEPVEITMPAPQFGGGPLRPSDASGHSIYIMK